MLRLRDVTRLAPRSGVRFRSGGGGGLGRWVDDHSRRKGLVREVKEVRSNRAKTVFAVPRPSDAAGSPLFPELATKSLLGEQVLLPRALEGQVTLVTLALRQEATAGARAWRNEFRRRLALEEDDAPLDVATMHVSVVDALLLRLFQSSIRRGLASSVPAQQHGSTLSYFGSSATLRSTLGIHNSLLACVVMTDRAGRVRWRAEGEPQPDELDNMASAALLLVREGRDRSKTLD